MTEVRAAGGAGTSRLSVVGQLGPAGAAVAAAGIAVNALAYVVPLLGARRLSAADLGALAALLAIGAIGTVPAQGLQTALAVRWARHGRVVNAGRATALTAAATAGALAIATPLISATLHVSPVLPMLLAATTVAVVLAGRWLGELQGSQRFLGLAAGMVVLSVARYGGVVAGLGLGAGVTGSLALGAAVAWLSLPVLAFLARRPHLMRVGAVPAASGADAQDALPDGDDRAAGSARLRGRDVAAASGATLAMLAISYADLILARHLLPAAEAGAYAVGSVLTKGALWAPQAVTVLALPRLARGSRRALLTALALVAACGGVLIFASLIAGGLAMGLAGGSGYTWLGRYAVGFATIGALYAIVFVLVNAEIAARVRWPAAPLWVSLVGLAVAARLLDPPTLGGILTVSVVTATVTTVVMGITATRTRPARPDRPRPGRPDRPARPGPR
jgi:hypothetical protein